MAENSNQSAQMTWEDHEPLHGKYDNHHNNDNTDQHYTGNNNYYININKRTSE